ncbi:hypothetical protein RAZWK3B_11581 [Roseobacter sp. AzwK-3b]|uniref:beta strand repeat-containing protein n=1 Tax=Roseobacter sp. AzwK-3b TaxID=351016 RepID=UPI000156A079|nr:calcium-binding protein [Roseobacter sp. AzwK-3b]EDM70247.1 hypothetical protein RAZWK3B_11581 [Roseobacter sp. AzwK-3b]
MAKDFAELNRLENEAGIQAPEAGTKEQLVNKFVKAWENETARRAVKGGTGLSMALTLAACGGSSGGGVVSTQDDGGTVPTPTPVSDLTVGIDTEVFAGVLNAIREYTPGGNDLVNTLQSGDIITGTGDADVMNVQLGNPNDSADTIITPTITGVETVNVESVADVELTLNLASATGLETVSATTTAADFFVALGDVGTAVEVRDVDGFNDAVATNIGFVYSSTAVAGSADAVSLSVDGVNGGVNIILGDSNQEGVESVTVNGTGAASDINQLVSNDVETLITTGSVTISGVSSGSLTLLDTSGATGDTEINIGANLVNAGFTYVGGDSDDTIIANTAFVGTASLDAGLGTDTLSIRTDAGVVNNVGALDAADAPVAAGFEVLSLRSVDGQAGVADFTVDMDILPGVTSIEMDARDTDAPGSTFTLNDLTVAQAGALSLDLSNEAGANATVVSDIKTDTTADAVVLDVAFAGEGGQTATLTTNATTESATVNVSGSAVGATDTLEASGAGSDSLTVTGGLAGATLAMEPEAPAVAFEQETLDLSGVASDITITLGAADQAVTTGAGDDTVTAGGNLTRADSIDMGEGVNTLEVTNASVLTVDSYTGTAAAVAAMEAAITNIDTLVVTDTLNDAFAGGDSVVDIDVDRFGGVQDVVIQGHSFPGESTTISSLQSGASITVLRNVDNLTLAVDNATLAGNEADELNLTVGDADAGTGMLVDGTLELAGIDILNISSEGTGSNRFDAMDASALDTLTVTGDNALVISTPLIDTIEVVDASGMTAGGLDVQVAAGGTTGVTMTGSDAVDILTGGSGDDIVSGGEGADQLVGGAGDDQITGGIGADLITGGAGGDTIDLTEAVASGDDVFFALGDGSAAGVAGGTFSGFDVITNFVSTSDDVDVTGVIGASTGAATVVGQNAATNNANDLADADYTDVDAVVAFLNDGGAALAPGGTDIDVVAITFSDFTALYSIDDTAGATVGTVEAGELALLGTADDILVAADIV